MSQLQTHPDGCLASNIATRAYRVTLVGKCPHTKVRSAEIILDAADAKAAAGFAETWLRQGPMRNTVIAGVDEVTR